MKRVFLTLTLTATLALSGAISASASSLSSQLLSQKQLPSWSRYEVAATLLARCPASSFQVSNSPNEARIILVQKNTETLIAEKLVTSSNPARLYSSAIAKSSGCPAATTINGSATVQRIHALNLGHFSVPVRSFSLYAAVEGAWVNGYVLYARKGNVVIEIGELSMGAINVHAFKADVVLALAKIPNAR